METPFFYSIFIVKQVVLLFSGINVQWPKVLSSQARPWTAHFFNTSENQSYNSPLQICIAGRMLFSKKPQTTCSFQIRTKNPTKKKFIVVPSFFTSWTIENEKCIRAHVQHNKSIYLPIHLSIWKPFWKRVCIYIYRAGKKIYIYRAGKNMTVWSHYY